MNSFSKFNFYQNRVVVNCLAKDLTNAKDVVKAAKNHVAIGLLSTRFPSVEENVELVKKYQQEIPLISIGLGSGSPNQWKMVAEIASLTDPGHVNQVFPASGYALGLLNGKNCDHTIVNALISPTGTPGKVIINTGVFSQEHEEVVDIKSALLMMKDIGLQSVKFYHMKGNKYIHELEVVASMCREVGIDMIEPTGGINLENLGDILDVCLNSGIKYIMPHIYSSIIDKNTGLTDVKAVREALEIIKHIVG